jgi:hypothetical protein
MLGWARPAIGVPYTCCRTQQTVMYDFLGPEKYARMTRRAVQKSIGLLST